jgi:LPXTG-motif cell wall-anchored protein
MLLAVATALWLAVPLAAFGEDTVVDPTRMGSITIHKFLLNGTYPMERNDGRAVPDNKTNGTTNSAPDGLPDSVPSDAQRLGGVADVTYDDLDHSGSRNGSETYTPVVFHILKVVPMETADNPALQVFAHEGVGYKLDYSTPAAQTLNDSDGTGAGLRLETDEYTGEATTGADSLPVGIYLVEEEKPAKVARPADPFLVSIPTTIQGNATPAGYPYVPGYDPSVPHATNDPATPYFDETTGTWTGDDPATPNFNELTGAYGYTDGGVFHAGDDPTTLMVDEGKGDDLLYDVHVYPKNEDIGIEKKVGTGVDTDTGAPGLQEGLTTSRGADAGEPVNWYIYADLPPQIADNGAAYVVYDTFGAGLEYIRGSVEVWVVKGTDYTRYYTDNPAYGSLYPTFAASGETVTLVNGTDYLVYPSDAVAGGGGSVKITLTDTGRAKLGFNGPDVSESRIGDNDPDPTLNADHATWPKDGQGDYIEDFSYYIKIHIRISTRVLDAAALNVPLPNVSELRFVNDASYDGQPGGYPDNPPNDDGSGGPADYADLSEYPEDPGNGFAPWDDGSQPGDDHPNVPDVDYPSTVENPSGPPQPTVRGSEERYVYTGGFHIVKEDAGDSSVFLNGARFKLVAVSAPPLYADFDAATAAAMDTGATGGNGIIEMAEWIAAGAPGSYAALQRELAAQAEVNRLVLGDASITSGYVQRYDALSGSYQDYEVETQTVGGQTGYAAFTGLSYGAQDAAVAQSQGGDAAPAYYYLIETAAPDKYSLPDANVIPVVRVDYTSLGAWDNSIPPQYTVAQSASAANIGHILNTKSFLLPFTGGEGAMLYVIVGLALAGAGLCLLVARRRQREVDTR